MTKVPTQEELELLKETVKSLNAQLGDLYEKYAGSIRISPHAGYKLDDYATISVEITTVFAKFGRD